MSPLLLPLWTLLVSRQLSSVLRAELSRRVWSKYDLSAKANDATTAPERMEL